MNAFWLSVFSLVVCIAGVKLCGGELQDGSPLYVGFKILLTAFTLISLGSVVITAAILLYTI